MILNLKGVLKKLIENRG